MQQCGVEFLYIPSGYLNKNGITLWFTDSTEICWGPSEWKPRKNIAKTAFMHSDPSFLLIMYLFYRSHHPAWFIPTFYSVGYANKCDSGLTPPSFVFRPKDKSGNGGKTRKKSEEMMTTKICFLSPLVLHVSHVQKFTIKRCDKFSSCVLILHNNSFSLLTNSRLAKLAIWIRRLLVKHSIWEDWIFGGVDLNIAYGMNSNLRQWIIWHVATGL